MSAETYAALEQALREHVADETDGGYLVHWHVAAHAVSSDDPDSSRYHYAHHDGPPHEWWGLLQMADRRARRWQDETGT